MAIMHQFKITAAAPTKKDNTPIGKFRRRLAEALSLQIDIATADAAGQSFKRLHQKWVKGDDGERELRNVPIAIRRWWWSDDKGVTYVTLKHGSKIIELAPGKNAIEVGPADQLPKQLTALREAVLAGELDEQARLPRDRHRGIPKASKASGTKSSSAKI